MLYKAEGLVWKTVSMWFRTSNTPPSLESLMDMGAMLVKLMFENKSNVEQY